jgi:lipopolysaccharide/colanic/teichoic acid biosynthesis glycosyltransferase
VKSNASLTSRVESDAEQELLRTSQPNRQDMAVEHAVPAFQLAERIEFPEVRVQWYVRALEIVIAGSALLLTLPLMLLIAVVIKHDSPGPALFFQTRVGSGRKPFQFVKFRTLYADARERFPDLYSYQYDGNEIEELKFKVPDDPRVTRAGNWLRQSTLDELPNFWCVLKGDMALVGPRPEIPEMLKYYHGSMLRKFDVRPGITGLAQISGRGRLGFLETVELDVEYVQNQSFWLDVKIFFRTILGVLVRDGAF